MRRSGMLCLPERDSRAGRSLARSTAPVTSGVPCVTTSPARSHTWAETKDRLRRANDQISVNLRSSPRPLLSGERPQFMRLTIDIPETQEAMSHACPVPLAVRGVRWSESCLGQNAKETGVYVIHHCGVQSRARRGVRPIRRDRGSNPAQCSKRRTTSRTLMVGGCL
jgi:hypothetical protein